MGHRIVVKTLGLLLGLTSLLLLAGCAKEADAELGQKSPDSTAAGKGVGKIEGRVPGSEKQRNLSNRGDRGESKGKAADGTEL